MPTDLELNEIETGSDSDDLYLTDLEELDTGSIIDEAFA